MKKYKFGISHIRSKTPKKIKRIANSVIVTCAIISGASLVNEYHVIAIISLLIGAISKGISEFFSDV